MGVAVDFLVADGVELDSGDDVLGLDELQRLELQLRVHGRAQLRVSAQQQSERARHLRKRQARLAQRGQCRAVVHRVCVQRAAARVCGTKDGPIALVAERLRKDLLLER